MTYTAQTHIHTTHPIYLWQYRISWSEFHIKSFGEGDRVRNNNSNIFFCYYPTVVSTYLTIRKVMGRKRFLKTFQTKQSFVTIRPTSRILVGKNINSRFHSKQQLREDWIEYPLFQLKSFHSRLMTLLRRTQYSTILPWMIKQYAAVWAGILAWHSNSTHQWRPTWLSRIASNSQSQSDARDL